MRRLMLSAALAAPLLLAAPARAQVEVTNIDCTNAAETSGHVRWPQANPVWEFDIVRPEATETGLTPRGTGLEIRDVFYRGRKVMERGNVPVINVEYDPGGCGCYRDWEDNEVNFVAGNALPGGQSCIAFPTAGSVMSTCDTGNGGTPGSFRGVSFEDYGTELVLTTHMSAGWYRYRMKWHFYTDGRIWPEYSYGANTATCTERGHRHHAYWRFDFDIDGTPTDDVLSEHDAAGNTTPLLAEASRTWGNGREGIYWSVRDQVTGGGYDVVPSAEDLLLPIDAFSKTDALALRYNPLELDDGGGGCAINYTTELNGESLVGEDVVFWYRSSALHTGGNPFECDIVGPTLNPVGLPVSAGAPAIGAGAVEIDAAVPNPFSPTTSLRFRVADSQRVVVTLYDALGRSVRVLYDGPLEGGRYETVQIDGTSLPTGTYVVRVQGETVAGTTRVVLAR